VSSPRWTDDELLQELAAALQEAPADEDFIRAGQAAFTWRTVDTDLELLGLATGSGQVAGALVRGGGRRALAFRGERMSVEIEIDKDGIVGQVTPPQPGQITLVTVGGPEMTTQADDVGCFAFPPPPAGPIRLDCRLGDDHFITEWVTV
jgi:hypothetical protein